MSHTPGQTINTTDLTVWPESIPPVLRAACVAYEAAVVANDLDALDHWFAPGEGTLRGDAAGLLVGHDVISAFRSARGGVSSRQIIAVEYRPLAADAALVVTTVRFDDGGRGLQTQLWSCTDAGWRISAAHVSPRPQAFDRSIWRVVGDPLVPPASPGALDGTTVAVKDLFSIEGHRIGAGNPTVLRDSPIQSTSASAVNALTSAGAAIRGIARTDEFAYSIAGTNPHYGTPPNPAAPTALPGGSSNGPAAAVALGQADIGLATDTAGSVRIPASYQGLWGLRTTHDLVARDGMLALAESFDTVGWLTRDGELLRTVVDTVAPQTSNRGDDVTDSELSTRIAIVDDVTQAAHAETRLAFDHFVDEYVGEHVDRVSFGDLDELSSAFRTVQAAEAWRNHGRWVQRHPDALGAAAAERFAFARQVSAEDEATARDVLSQRSAELQELAAGRVLLFPTAPGPAPARNANATEQEQIRAATLRMSTPSAVAGLPTLSVPALSVSTGRGTGNAPVGVSFVSPPGTDATLVAYALSLFRRGSTIDNGTAMNTSGSQKGTTL